MELLTQPPVAARRMQPPSGSSRMAAAVLPRVLNSASVTQTDRGCQTLTFQAMGTACHVTFPTAEPAKGSQFMQSVLHWVAGFEAKYSRFIPDSLIGRINAAAGKDWVAIDAETERIFALCDQLIFLTRNAFDPTALPLMQLWNWKAQPPVIPDQAAIAAARELVGWDKFQRKAGAVYLSKAGMCLDLGGIGKEYAVDCVSQIATQSGIASVLVDFGQDIRAVGQPPQRPAWHIGLENPAKPGTTRASVAARNVAVATSGDYLRCFIRDGRRYGHIIDPRNGRPVDNGCQSVTVLAPSCTMAGVLSTTAFILGPDEGIRFIESCAGAEGCLVTASETRETRRFQAYVVH